MVTKKCTKTKNKYQVFMGRFECPHWSYLRLPSSLIFVTFLQNPEFYLIYEMFLTFFSEMFIQFMTVISLVISTWYKFIFIAAIFLALLNQSCLCFFLLNSCDFLNFLEVINLPFTLVINFVSEFSPFPSVTQPSQVSLQPFLVSSRNDPPFFCLYSLRGTL